jgi:hypothetical protein
MRKGREPNGLFSAIMDSENYTKAAIWCFEMFGKQNQPGYKGIWSQPCSGSKFLFENKVDRDYFMKEWQ